MIDLKQLQNRVLQNKINKGFNTSDLNKEFCYLYGEVSEAYEAWMKNKEDLNEELADVATFLLGISEMLDINLENEIKNKIEKNEKRIYKNINGVLQKISNTN